MVLMQSTRIVQTQSGTAHVRDLPVVDASDWNVEWRSASGQTVVKHELGGSYDIYFQGEFVDARRTLRAAERQARICEVTFP